jgi:hypothetical protein
VDDARRADFMAGGALWRYFMSQTVDESVDLSMNAEQVYWPDHVRERPELPPDL